MPAKQAISVKSPTKHQKLTPIENQLLECAKSGKPVLLYGKDNIGRKDLILRIHILSGGINSSYEFFDPAGKPISRGDFMKNVAAWHMSNETCHPIDLCHSRSTSRTWDYVNCSGMEAKKFYEELVEKTTKLERELDASNAIAWKVFYSRIAEVQNRFLADDEKIMLIESPLNTLQQRAKTPVGRKFSGCLFECNGLLFIDNLSIYNKNDINFYDKLANIIEDRWLNYHMTTFNWLVVYMPDLENLPPSLAYFREQFEPVSLAPDKQKEEVETTINQNNTFRWSGGTWEITFEGKTIRPPDSFGLKYIHYLLKYPDKEIYAIELRLITGTQLRERSNKSYDEEKKDNEESSGIESGDKMNKILNSASIEEIKRAIGYLSEQLVGAEEEEKAELLDRKTSLELHLKKATNINADSRDFPTDLEKARKAVSRCITNSLKIIKKEHTTLEQYLFVTIKMGTVFQYKHTSKIDWQLS